MKYFFYDESSEVDFEALKKATEEMDRTRFNIKEIIRTKHFTLSFMTTGSDR